MWGKKKVPKEEFDALAAQLESFKQKLSEAENGKQTAEYEAKRAATSLRDAQEKCKALEVERSMRARAWKMRARR